MNSSQSSVDQNIPQFLRRAFQIASSPDVITRYAPHGAIIKFAVIYGYILTGENFIIPTFVQLKQKCRIEMQHLLRTLVRFCNPQRKRVAKQRLAVL